MLSVELRAINVVQSRSNGNGQVRVQYIYVKETCYQNICLFIKHKYAGFFKNEEKDLYFMDQYYLQNEYEMRIQREKAIQIAEGAILSVEKLEKASVEAATRVEKEEASEEDDIVSKEAAKTIAVKLATAAAKAMAAKQRAKEAVKSATMATTLEAAEAATRAAEEAAWEAVFATEEAEESLEYIVRKYFENGIPILR